MLSEKNFAFLSQIGKAIAAQFGEDCEVVIHKVDPEDMNHSIVSIENGHVSSREIGDGPSQVVLETLKKNPAELEDRYNYLTRTHDGRILKSSTLYFKDAEGKLDAIFSINYDTTSLLAAEHVLHKLTMTEDSQNENPEIIPKDVNGLLDDLIQESVKLVGRPVSLMTKDDKIKAIQYLNNKGAFLITKSGDKISKFFGISKYTLYSYIG